MRLDTRDCDNSSHSLTHSLTFATARSLQSSGSCFITILALFQLIAAPLWRYKLLVTHENFFTQIVTCNLKAMPNINGCFDVTVAEPR